MEKFDDKYGSVFNNTNKNLIRYEKRKVKDDFKEHFYFESETRIINHADGFIFSLPTNDFKYDYSLAACRSKYYFNDCVLNVSYEDKNPYFNKLKEKAWDVYLDEWLIRYISNADFLKANNIKIVHESIHENNFLNQYELIRFSYFINDAKDLKYPYYNIAILRQKDDYVNFYLFVLKSSSDSYETMSFIISSFLKIKKEGKSCNDEINYALKEDENWNEETKRYFNHLKNQDKVDWGIFLGTIVHESDSSYEYCKKRYENETKRLESKMEHNFELLATYMHISYQNKLNYFPLSMAKEYASGNGFNNKKVLHFTFQYTANNNTSLFGYSPTYDILRGKYDEYFHRLAKDIKKYQHPVLFRLNNEMNTDWTSYAGIISLLDPDIFILTWKRLFDIFKEEKVDNCIWIFNPIAITTPFCNWGEYLSYFPKGMVHMLGLTSYERGNNKDDYSMFSSLYKKLYEKNVPYFSDYPWIISEFGAGAGGEIIYDYDSVPPGYNKVIKARNKDKQVEFVKDMFTCFKNKEYFIKNIKGAIWFSANDYGYFENSWQITNYFALDDSLDSLLDEFKNGFTSKK